MTLKSDLDLEYRWVGHKLCTPSSREDHLSGDKCKSCKGFRTYRADTKFKGKSHELEV